MGSIIDITPARDLHAFTIDNEILLFQSRSDRLYRLNPTASLIWEGLSAGMTIPDIAKTLSRTTRVHLNRVASDIDLLVSRWNKMGFFKATDSPKIESRPTESDLEEEIEFEKGEVVLSLQQDRPGVAFRILDTDFFVDVPSAEILVSLVSIFLHLAVTSPQQKYVHLSVLKTNIRYLLLVDGVPADWCRRKDGIAPMVYANALMAAYDQADCLIGVHSAAVAVDGRCIMLPALSGSGKSTLTAALTGFGFQYLADDLVLLSETPVRMRPVPVAIGLKEGAWPVLADNLPEICGLTTHKRADEKVVRYFVPWNDPAKRLDCQLRPVDAIVFPNYVNGAALSLKEISRADALCRIADAGYDVHRGLTLKVLEQLVNWIAATPCFELHFSCLNQAADALQSIAE